MYVYYQVPRYPPALALLLAFEGFKSAGRGVREQEKRKRKRDKDDQEKEKRERKEKARTETKTLNLEASGRLKQGIMRTQRITIRIEEGKYKTLKAEAERLGIKITALIKHLTYRYLNEIRQGQIAETRKR